MQAQLVHGGDADLAELARGGAVVEGGGATGCGLRSRGLGLRSGVAFVVDPAAIAANEVDAGDEGQLFDGRDLIRAGLHAHRVHPGHLLADAGDPRRHLRHVGRQERHVLEGDAAGGAAQRRMIVYPRVIKPAGLGNKNLTDLPRHFQTLRQVALGVNLRDVGSRVAQDNLCGF